MCVCLEMGYTPLKNAMIFLANDDKLLILEVLL